MKQTRCLQGFSLLTLMIATSSGPRVSLVTKVLTVPSAGSLGGFRPHVYARPGSCHSCPVPVHRCCVLLCRLMTFLSRITCALSCLRARRTLLLTFTSCPRARRTLLLTDICLSVCWTDHMYTHDQAPVLRVQLLCTVLSFSAVVS
jgi:hypothetical protein